MTAAQILIVDDDPALLEALPDALRLRMGDIDIDTRDSAQAALEQVAETEYDALVVDIKMPGMDGLELLAEIKKLRPNTPTLLITGHGDHQLAVQALRGGAHDYVTKPIDREYFVASLSRAIECHRLSREVLRRRQELLRHTEDLETCVRERTLELREALHREQVARADLDKANRQREMFLSMVAHDLATPLTTIRGYAEMLGRSSVSPERQQRARAVIISEADRLARLAGDLVDSAQLAIGRFRTDPAPCDLSRIIREQVELARAHSDRHTIRLNAPSELTIIGDCDRLAQLLSNLLNNAIKHTPGGVIEVALTRGGGQASLSVRNSGPGIPADQAELIFEPGRRVVNGEPHDSAGGTGLGLHIARGIVEAHGGRIWVENAEGEGATFWVALPTVVEVNTAAAQDMGGVRES